MGRGVDKVNVRREREGGGDEEGLKGEVEEEEKRETVEDEERVEAEHIESAANGYDWKSDEMKEKERESEESKEEKERDRSDGGGEEGERVRVDEKVEDRAGGENERERDDERDEKKKKEEENKKNKDRGERLSFDLQLEDNAWAALVDSSHQGPLIPLPQMKALTAALGGGYPTRIVSLTGSSVPTRTCK